MKQTDKEQKTIEAYNIIAGKNQLNSLYLFKKEIDSTELEKQGKYVSSFIFGKGKDNAEFVARQFLSLRLSTIVFNEKLLLGLAFKKPVEDELMPKEWRRILQSYGIPVNNGISSIKFCIYIFIRFVFNCKKACGLLLSLFFLGKKNMHSKKYVQFLDIDKGCLPGQGVGKEYTAIDWYINWQGRVQDFTEIHHNVNSRPGFSHHSYQVVPASPFPDYLHGFKAKFQLLGWFLGAFFISVYSLLRGRWINALLLYEAMLAKVIDMTDPAFLAREYLFSISGVLYRPLWTYIAQYKGALITNYSYASSFGGLKVRNEYIDTEYYFDTTTWPRLLFWTDDYVSYLKLRVKASVKVIHTGSPVFASDYPFTFPVIPSRSIAVFDISPTEPYVIARLLPPLAYRTFENGKQFLTDIYETFAKAGFTIVWKRKRAFNSIHSKEYIAFCDAFEKLPNVVIIHPDVSAFHVVEKCDYCISMPFTSTAFIAGYYKKPSVFFDSTGLLYKDDRGLQGIPLISGLQELVDWRKQLQENESTEKPLV